MSSNAPAPKISGDGEVPEDAQRLILSVVDSVQVLDALVLFYQHPEREWLEAEIASQLRVAGPWTRFRLDAMTRSGVLTKLGPAPSTYRYYPCSMRLNAAVASLVRIYRERPQTIIGFIHSRPQKSLWRVADGLWH